MDSERISLSPSHRTASASISSAGHAPRSAGGIGWTSWWRHQMQTFSALLALCEGNSPVTGEFPSQRPETQSFDVFFDLRMNKRLSKQSRRRWFDTPSRSLRRHYNQMVIWCRTELLPTLGGILHSSDPQISHLYLGVNTCQFSFILFESDVRHFIRIILTFHWKRRLAWTRPLYGSRLRYGTVHVSRCNQVSVAKCQAFEMPCTM